MSNKRLNMNTMRVSLDWVPQSVYLELYMEKSTQIDERIKRHLWKRGVHFNVRPGSKGRWINLRAVSEWASGKNIAV